MLSKVTFFSFMVTDFFLILPALSSPFHNSQPTCIPFGLTVNAFNASSNATVHITKPVAIMVESKGYIPMARMRS